jgi:general stress protein 26
VQEEPKKKWITFTYVGKETRYVTDLFKNHNVDIALHTNNSLEKHVSIKGHKGVLCDHCGVYRLICQDCGGA